MGKSLAWLTLPFFPLSALEQVSRGLFLSGLSSQSSLRKYFRDSAEALHEKHASFKAEPFSIGLRKALEVLVLGGAMLAHLTSKPMRQYIPLPQSSCFLPIIGK